MRTKDPPEEKRIIEGKLRNGLSVGSILLGEFCYDLIMGNFIN